MEYKENSAQKKTHSKEHVSYNYDNCANNIAQYEKTVQEYLVGIAGKAEYPEAGIRIPPISSDESVGIGQLNLLFSK